MRLLKTAIAIIISVGLALSSNVRDVRANVMGDLAGIATDPLKFGHLSDRIQETTMGALAQIDTMMGKADDIARQRLDQLKSIINFAIQGGAAVEAKAFSDLLTLESKIYDDVDRIIFDARCAAIATLNGTAQDALVKAMENIAKSQPTLEILGFPVMRLHFRTVTLPAPNDAYFASRNEVYANLDKSVHDNTDAYTIIAAYANLENLAESTRCFYLHKPEEIRFIREQSKLEIKQQAWNAIVSIVH